MIEKLVNHVRTLKPKEITLVGITGFQGAGKSTLLRGIGEYLGSNGVGFETLSSDAYHNLTRREKGDLFRALKAEGKDLLDIMFRAYTHNTALMRDHLLKIKQGIPIHQTGLYDGKSGEKTATLDISLTRRPTWVVVEGVYILQDDLGKLLDATVFLDASKEERLRRTTERQRSRLGAHSIDLDAFEAMEKANQEWITPHLEEPYIHIDNTNFFNPILNL